MTTRFYGDGGTIHGNTEFDVETRDGKVVAVWFRCAALPFKQTEVDAERAKEMARMYTDGAMPRVRGLQLADGNPIVGDRSPSPVIIGTTVKGTPRPPRWIAMPEHRNTELRRDCSFSRPPLLLKIRYPILRRRTYECR